MENRIHWVDYGKGIGIILVAYAHLLSSGYHAGLKIPEHFFGLSDSIVYSFHMPFFFFLSGFFIESSLHKRGTRAYLLDKFLKIAYPYLVWSIIQVSVEVIFSSQTQRGAGISDMLAIPYRPWGQFWFLYALLLMHITYAAFTQLGRFSKPLLLMLALGLFFYPIESGFLSLAGFSLHFLFFICGMLFKNLFTSLESKDISSWVAGALSTLLVVSGIIVFESYIPPVRLADGSHPFYFLFFSIFGITGCALLSQTLAKKNKFGILRMIGVYSLPIFLVHMLAGVATRVILINVFDIQNWMIHMIAGVGIALAAPIILYRVSIQIGFPYLFEPLRRFSAPSPADK